MDKNNALKKKLRKIFSELNNSEERYSEVWLSDVETDFFYKIDMLILNIRPLKEQYSTKAEIEFVLELLSQKAKPELQRIMEVKVHRPADRIHCATDEILLFEKEVSEPE